MEVPQFFVPSATAENQESVYAEFARWAAQPVPPLAGRVYSITFDHDLHEWTATVGKSLRAFAHSNRHAVSDPATVLAIFPGNPYVVITDHRIAQNVGSAWENPFYAGRPKSVVEFSVAQSSPL